MTLPLEASPLHHACQIPVHRNQANAILQEAFPFRGRTCFPKVLGQGLLSWSLYHGLLWEAFPTFKAVPYYFHFSESGICIL